MFIFKAFQWVRRIQFFMFFVVESDQKLLLFQIPPSGGFLLGFRSDLMPKCSILEGHRRPPRPKRASRSTHAAPNSIQILICNCSSRHVFNKPRSGEAGGSILDGFGRDLPPNATCNGPHVQRATLHFQRATFHFRHSGFCKLLERFWKHVGNMLVHFGRIGDDRKRC